MQDAVKRVKARECTAKMKELIGPHTIAIEMTSADSISMENWISALEISDVQGGKVIAKELAAAFQRFLKNHEKASKSAQSAKLARSAKSRKTEKMRPTAQLDAKPQSNLSDIPLFRLTAASFWECIERWIRNDVQYKKVQKAMKDLCREYRISGDVLPALYVDGKEDPKLIEDAFKTKMGQYLTKKTMNMMLEGLRAWIKDHDADDLRGVTTDKIANVVLEFPIGNLQKVIMDKRIGGKRFIEDPEGFGKTVHKVTGWTNSECDLLRKTMERRVSLTADQFMERVESRAKEKRFTSSVIIKMKHQVLTKCNLEDVHYDLRTKGMVHRDFSESVLNLLSDLLAERTENEIEDENQFVVDYFDILSSVSLMMTVDGDGNEVNGPYICPCCGNLNVVKNVGYRYTDNISVCSLCGVSAKESVAMALKRVPLPYQGTLTDDNVDEITLYNPTTSIHSEALRWAQNKRMDLHCAVQKDSNLSPVLQRVALMLMEQTRFRMLIDGKRKDIKLSEQDLTQFISPDVYKETFLGAAEDKLINSKKDHSIKDEAIKSLRTLLQDEKHPVCDFAKYFSGKGLRKEFLNILKETTGMNGGTAGGIFKSVISQLRNMVFTEQYRLWLQALDVEEIKSDREYIDKYHLDNASAFRKEVILSFFRGAIGDEDGDDKTERFPKEPAVDELNHFRLRLLNRDDTKDDEDDEHKTIEVTSRADGAKKQCSNPWKFITENEATNEFAFGVEMNYISLKPKFKSIREELHAIGFSHVFFNNLAKAIEKYLAVRKNNCIFQVSREYAKKHGILRDQYISMIQLVAVLLYTDCSEFSCIL